MSTKITRTVLKSNVPVSSDVFIRQLDLKGNNASKYYLTLTIGPTPMQIRDNVEEFEVDITLPIKPGMTLRQLIQAFISIEAKFNEVFAFGSLLVH